MRRFKRGARDFFWRETFGFLLHLEVVGELQAYLRGGARWGGGECQGLGMSVSQPIASN